MPDAPVPLATNLDLLDEMYARFTADPASVDESWRAAFASVNQLADLPRAGATTPAGVTFVDATRAAETAALVTAYRARGHLEATLDPLGTYNRDAHTDLDFRSHGFAESELERLVSSGGVAGLPATVPLRQLIEHLRATYSGTVGVEFMHITTPERRRWLIERIESTRNRSTFDARAQTFVLEQLTLATELERFIDAKYLGSKRFSIEGGETLIPLVHRILERAGEQGVTETVVGMAHRGRLNVLVNLLGLSAQELFSGFEDFDPRASLGGGDVKYHLGHSTEYTTRVGKQMHLSLTFNPSHLEAVDPVVVGRVRAKQRRRGDTLHQKVLGVLIHGDAAFAGQGLVAEVLNLSDLHGFRTGGTVHVIVNNQIGFTTSPTEARSTPYCTDVAKGIQCPIFHVNGDDPEAVLHVVDMAMDYRTRFASDVVIDMFCFRRHGHNEMDEPSFTQPLLYERIKKHPDAYEIYGEQLIRAGVVTRKQIDERVGEITTRLAADLDRAKPLAQRPHIASMSGVWRGFAGGLDDKCPDADTTIARERLQAIAERLTTIPVGFVPHPKIERLLEQRAEMGRGRRPIDWATAELMAFASLLWDGRLVRLSGQDSQRGTFSQRHAVIVDIKSGVEFSPLHVLTPGQGQFRIYDSSLSEAAVLGFEFGYSLDYPEALVCWEAQFGDFANGAQVIIDQFVSASEDRWTRLSGLVMLLPHGYEGQGPEHSSARIERYLQNCAEDNWQICFPTTPAQYFHLLRRQALRAWRKPLVVLTPKSMLRLPQATSTLDELATGTFRRVLPDPESPNPENVKRVLLCTGKIYWDLAEERRRRGDTETAIVRIEQLYPVRDALIVDEVNRYPRATDIVWVQEEPANMGAATFLYRRMRHLANDARKLRLVARVESASPATGSSKAHAIEQRTLLDEAFGA